MASEFRRRTKVKPGGQIEVSVPELRTGENVEVVVLRDAMPESNGKRPGFGNARGQIMIDQDFDGPLTDFSDYL